MATITDAPSPRSLQRGAGPLTTVFTTPDFCGTVLWTATDTPPLHSEICMPPKFHSLYVYKYGFYSPGICPSGYSEGCAFPTALATETLGTQMYGGPLLPGEEARMCCPSGYQCYTSGSQSESFWSNCISTKPLTTHWQWDYGKNTDVMTTTEALAYAVQVRWQTSDLSVLATDPTVPGSTFDGPVPTAVASVTAATGAPEGENTGGGSRGISTGALTAIAITVPVGLLAFGIVAFILWRRNYRKKHGKGDAAAMEETADNNSTMGGPSSSTRLNHELLSPPHDGQRSDTPNTALVSPLTPNTMFTSQSTTELGSHTVNEMDAHSVHEADSKPRQLVEMEAAGKVVHEMPHTFVAELDGTPVEWRRAAEVASDNNHMRQRSLSRTTKPPPLKS